MKSWSWKYEARRWRVLPILNFQVIKMGLAKALIKQMVSTLDEDSLWYQKREFLVSKMDELKSNPSEFAEWIKLYLTQCGNNKAFNHVFESLLMENLQYLHDDYFPPLSELAAHLFSKDKDNLAAEIFLFEAKHLSSLPEQYHSIKTRQWYPERKFNAAIKKTYDILFPSDYSISKQLKPYTYNQPKATLLFAFGGKSHQIKDPNINHIITFDTIPDVCLLYTSPSPRDATLSRMPSSA